MAKDILKSYKQNITSTYVKYEKLEATEDRKESKEVKKTLLSSLSSMASNFSFSFLFFLEQTLILTNRSTYLTYGKYL
jgi:hypothetical protein